VARRNVPATAAPTKAPAPTARHPARPRRERAPEPAVDAEAPIEQVVGKLQAQGNAEAERLRSITIGAADFFSVEVWTARGLDIDLSHRLHICPTPADGHSSERTQQDPAMQPLIPPT
jgi:hypothetical protein